MMSSEPANPAPDEPIAAPADAPAAVTTDPPAAVTTDEPAAITADERERRLHPWSLIFNMGQVVRAFFIPAVLVLVSAGRQSDVTWFVAGTGSVAALIILAALIRYFTFRFRYGAAELIVRSGLLFRNERHIPYDRIQNLDAVQTLVHRLLGVVTVNIQTGSGTEPEASLSVLPVRAMHEMRRRVATGRVDTAARSAPAVEPAVLTQTTLLHLGPGELLLCGFIENRGMVLILSVIGLLSQQSGVELRVLRGVEERIPFLETAFDAARASFAAGGVPVRGTMLAVVGLLILLVAIRMISMLWAAVRLHDFRLTDEGERLRLEYGLFTRVAATIPLRRIQSVSVHETLLHRWLGYAAVRVTTAGGGVNVAARDREWLAPLIARSDVPALLDRLQPGVLLEPEWRPVHPRAFRRALRVSSARALVPAAAVALLASPGWALALLVVLLVRAAIRSRMLVRHLGWAITDAAVTFRGGWMRRVTTAARYPRIQSVALRTSPFDRRLGMASVVVDTAGVARANLRMFYLAADDARDIRRIVADRATATPFTW